MLIRVVVDCCRWWRERILKAYAALGLRREEHWWSGEVNVKSVLEHQIKVITIHRLRSRRGEETHMRGVHQNRC